MTKCKYCDVSNQGEICNLCRKKLALIRKMKIILQLLKMGLNPLEHKSLYDDITYQETGENCSKWLY